jgi:hypothetical protein
MADTAAPPEASQGESDPIAQAGSTPDSVTVNAGPPTPQPQTQTPDAGQVQPTPQEPGPTVLVKQHRGGLAGIVDEFRDAVAGTQGRGVYINPDTGERFVQHPNLTGKQQWMKIAGEALTGAAAGFAAGHGAGNMAKAPLAGIQAQLQNQQKATDTQDQQAEQDYERDKQAKLAKANSQLLATQVASNQFKLQRMGVEAGEQDIKFSQEQDDREKQLGSADLGTYGFDNLHEVQKNDPDFWAHHYADNSIRVVPSYNGDGTRNGIHVWLRQPGIGDQPAPEGTQIRRFVPPATPGEKPTFEPLTLSGHHTLNEVDAYNAASQKQYQDWETAQLNQGQKSSEIQKNLSEVPKNAAEAANARTEAGLHSEQAKALQNVAPEVNNAAQQLVEGTMDPGQLSRKSKSYGATLAAANAYSMQTTGKPFDAAKAAGDYSFANKAQTKNTLNYVNSLVGHDNQGGNLAQIVQMSKQLGNTQFPPINDVAQWARLSAGSPQVAAYRAALLETSDQIAKILQGGGAGTSDAKLKQGQEILNQNFNAAQIAAVADKSLRPLLANRKQEMIGDNRYLQRWYGQPANQAPPGATAEVHNQQGQLIGHVVNGAFKPLATQ